MTFCVMLELGGSKGGREEVGRAGAPHCLLGKVLSRETILIRDVSYIILLSQVPKE